MYRKKLLSEAYVERFKSNCIINALSEQICDMAKKQTFDKYKDVKITKNSIEFELLKVFAYSTSGSKLSIELRLVYIICSKLPKREKERLDKFKEEITKENYFSWHQESKLWEGFSYDITSDDVLDNNINLKIW